jgi:hypothetical protein
VNVSHTLQAQGAPLSFVVQLWNDLLDVSGGLMEVTKRSYHIIYFSFHPNGPPFMKSGIRGPPLKLTTSLTGQPIYVAMISTYDTHKTLGHYKTSNTSPRPTKLYPFS